MSEFVRKAQPDCIRYILEYLKKATAGEGSIATATVSSDQLVRLLIKEAGYAKPTAVEAVENCIHDGLLSRMSTLKLLRLASKLPSESRHDFYCFECHLPGTLEYCCQCSRSFHQLCHRKDPERPNYTVPSAKLQKNRLPAFSSDTDTDSEAQHTVQGSTPIDYESDARATSSLLPLDQASINSCTPNRLVDEVTVDSASSPLAVNGSFGGCVGDAGTTSTPNAENSVDDSVPKMFLDDPSDLETKSKVDVVCLGEIRPPTRKRPTATVTTAASTVSYKSEISVNDEGDLDMELCTCCRLLKYAALRNPPNLLADELCYLLRFTFERNRSWLAHDVHSYLESMKLSGKEKELVMKLLLKIHDKNLESIGLKLNEQRYNYLMEFFVDILDLQHNIGVFFGQYSTEMESTKWFVRDISHDLSEIRRCPDCFRYSHEKRCNAWFAMPCVQRHELVFAKHKRSPYWPAKVVRVLANNKYDVRFFGGDHSRALIDDRYIRPIDTDVKLLKIGNNSGIRKAMQELRYYQILSTYPPEKFSFHADKHETDSIMNCVLSAASGMMETERIGVRGRKRKSRCENPDIAVYHGNAGSVIEDTAAAAAGEGSSGVPSKRNRSNKEIDTFDESPQRITRSKNSSGFQNSNVLKQVQEDLNEALKIADATRKKNEKLIAQIKKLKELIKQQEYEKKITKRKQWCYWCLNEAIYLCCIRAAYCSKECQSRHWNDGHSKVCKNQSDQGGQATSTT